jgi:ubiquinone/menaquinone biosynthesis C-methylase UbiE
MGFEEDSYSRHAQSYSGTKNATEELNRYLNWFEKDTVDLQRHLRMLSILNPFLHTFPKASWITVADGRFGTSATYIEKKGGRVTATDIDDTFLILAGKHGLITTYAKANAEALPFADNAFDFSYCKQAYHHFPRPFLSLYEMLRVSRKAVLFTEPADWVPLPVTGRILQLAKRTLKRMLNIKVIHSDSGNFEAVDQNYVFTISEREMEKSAMALNLPAVAFKRFHDVYIPGVEDELSELRGPLSLKLNRKRLQNRLMTAMGLLRPNTIQYILFKELPSEELLRQLKQENYTYVLLPVNPYL